MAPTCPKLVDAGSNLVVFGPTLADFGRFQSKQGLAQIGPPLGCPGVPPAQGSRLCGSSVPGPKSNQTDLGSYKDARARGREFLRLQFWPQSHFSRSRCDPADRLGTSEIGSATKAGVGATDFILRIRAMRALFRAKVELLGLGAGIGQPAWSTSSRHPQQLPAGRRPSHIRRSNSCARPPRRARWADACGWSGQRATWRGVEGLYGRASCCIAQGGLGLVGRHLAHRARPASLPCQPRRAG